MEKQIIKEYLEFSVKGEGSQEVVLNDVFFMTKDEFLRCKLYKLDGYYPNIFAHPDAADIATKWIPNTFPGKEKFSEVRSLIRFAEPWSGEDGTIPRRIFKVTRKQIESSRAWLTEYLNGVHTGFKGAMMLAITRADSIEFGNLFRLYPGLCYVHLEYVGSLKYWDVEVIE